MPPEMDSGAIRRFYESQWRRKVRAESSLIARLTREALRAAMQAMEEHSPIEDAWRLEIGPGLEPMRWRPGYARLIALDLAASALQSLSPDRAGVQGDGQRLPFRDSALDALYANSVLMHCDLEKTIAGFRRCLKPSGRVVLLEPLAGNPWMKWWRRIDRTYAALARWHESAAIEACLGRHFRRVTVQRFHLNPPLFLLPEPLRSAMSAVDAFLLRRFPAKAWIGLFIGDA
jgi:SAM-dependent methyltransferase